MTKDPVDQLNVELFKILRLRFAPRSHDKLGVCLQSETPIRMDRRFEAYGAEILSIRMTAMKKAQVTVPARKVKTERGMTATEAFWLKRPLALPIRLTTEKGMLRKSPAAEDWNRHS